MTSSGIETANFLLIAQCLKQLLFMNRISAKYKTSEDNTRKVHISTLLEPGMPVYKLCDFSPQANYTDRATAAGRSKLMPTFEDRWCIVVSATDPHGR
jgi:hypothetical protein